MTYHPHPGDNLPVLAAAGVDAHVARLRAELEQTLSATWRGRLALRLSSWRVRARS